MKNTNQLIGCCGLDTCADCPKMDGCPTLGRIAANSPFVLENLNRLREAKQNENEAAETVAGITLLGIL